MKKKTWLVLLFAFVCLLTVGCGKDEDDDDNKSSKKESSVKTLVCTSEGDESKVTMTIKQDQKTYKFTEVVMTTSTAAADYEEIGYTEKDLEELACDEEEFKKCSVKKVGDEFVVEMEYDVDDFEKETLEDDEFDIDELDANSLKKIKEAAEEEDFSCKIS